MSDAWPVQLLVFMAPAAIAFVAVTALSVSEQEVTRLQTQVADLQFELTQCKLELLQTRGSAP